MSVLCAAESVGEAHICIRSISGTDAIAELAVSLEDTIWVTKKRIANILGIPPRLQDLLFGDHVLTNKCALCDQGVTHSDHTLVLVRKPAVPRVDELHSMLRSLEGPRACHDTERSKKLQAFFEGHDINAPILRVDYESGYGGTSFDAPYDSADEEEGEFACFQEPPALWHLGTFKELMASTICSAAEWMLANGASPLYEADVATLRVPGKKTILQQALFSRNISLLNELFQAGAPKPALVDFLQTLPTDAELLDESLCTDHLQRNCAFLKWAREEMRLLVRTEELGKAIEDACQPDGVQAIVCDGGFLNLWIAALLLDLGMSPGECLPDWNNKSPESIKRLSSSLEASLKPQEDGTRAAWQDEPEYYAMQESACMQPDISDDEF